jgi:uncharacterized membrane protein YjjP (DUF1212 family)
VSILEDIRPRHYAYAVAFSSVFCGFFIHLASGVTLCLALAVFAAWPVIYPFMKYQERSYQTPLPQDFPILLVLYPIYFALLFYPLLLIGQRNNKKQNKPRRDNPYQPPCFDVFP